MTVKTEDSGTVLAQETVHLPAAFPFTYIIYGTLNDTNTLWYALCIFHRVHPKPRRRHDEWVLRCIAPMYRWLKASWRGQSVD